MARLSVKCCHKEKDEKSGHVGMWWLVLSLGTGFLEQVTLSTYSLPLCRGWTS